MAKKKAKKNMESRLMLLAVTLVVGTLAFSVGLRSAGLREQETEYIQKEAVLEKELQKEKERTAALKKKKDQAYTLEHVEEIAKKTLGLQYPNEISFREK